MFELDTTPSPKPSSKRAVASTASPETTAHVVACLLLTASNVIVVLGLVLGLGFTFYMGNQNPAYRDFVIPNVIALFAFAVPAFAFNESLRAIIHLLVAVVEKE